MGKYELSLRYSPFATHHAHPSLCTPVDDWHGGLPSRVCLRNPRIIHLHPCRAYLMATATAVRYHDASFAKDHLKAFVEHIERLEEEKKALADDVRDV